MPGAALCGGNWLQIALGTSSQLWRMASVSWSLSAWSGCCFQLIFVFPLWILLLARADAVSVNRSQEVGVLLNFRDANNATFYGGYWLSWKETDETPCAWFGVTCTANSIVEELDFSGWGLSFITLDGLYNLTGLRVLDLSSNSIDKTIDGIGLGVGNFTGLTQLDLSSTGAQGAIPASISACQNLRFLALDQNQFDTLPPGMSDLVNLQFLSLSNNSFTGAFPTKELGNLSSLVNLDLSYNSFSGDIPSLPNLTSLLVLSLDYNIFTGFEEPWFFGAESLQQLSVAYNQLEGSIPVTITNLTNLRFLNMSGNNLSGHIPPGFSGLRNHGYSSIDLSRNQLTGLIPTDMLMQTNPSISLASVDLSYNRLTGNIPLDGSTPYYFLQLDLSHNNLTGPVPSNIFSHPNTVVFSLLLNDNQLSGDIVEIFFTGFGLLVCVNVRLENNLFTGDLSRLVNRTFLMLFLEVMDLSNNNLQWSTSETIPDPITATLKVLTLSYPYPYLLEFRAGGNNFSGTPLPSTCFVSNTSNNLSELDLSNSQLQGELFGAAFNSTCLPAIQVLNLSHNHATGALSESVIAGHQQDFILDVSNNSLSGPLPSILPSNNLYNPKYFAGNEGLCGDPLPPCPQLLPKQRTGVQWWVLLIIIAASVTIATGLSCLAASWRLRVYRKQHRQDADLIRTLLERDSAALMPLRDLKKATCNFADSAQIGEGGFGTVYVGSLNDGTRVAIKRSKREGSDKDKEQFLNEVRILSQVNHRNLVKLMGCCMENKIAVLVFEFISNGTLQEHLQGKFGAVRLTWKQRLHVAVQTADALHYLHSMASFPIYHRDVKSANILLDENLNAKVADFGISKLAPLQATHVSTVAIQGTIGYIDPEYYTSYQLTDKSDVYSFGVVLLELISAKPALDFMRGGEETSLVYFARPYIERGDLGGVVDPALGETYSGDGGESILSVGKIAMKCVDMRIKSRPSMHEVWKELENLKDDFEGTSEQVAPSTIDDTDEDLQSGERCLLFDSSSTDASNFVMQNESGGIQMSDISRTHSVKGGSRRE